ncbi:SubName: Full=Uncharacterized protein {ECO:0000313/EMBL:CCA69180.1} [Serendipita indica DSM 11827]|nr:SubName: Full=Uncharacterized protein {ECO:0000313/EMBL:CCA69180.1} [Serendipita indica DSM 11827]
MTGSVARIWKFTPTGCTVTSTIRYLERPDDLLRFVHALALNGRRGLGLCVGSDRLFRDVGFTGTDSVANDYEVDLTKKLEKIARIYVQYSNNKQWAERQRLTSVWVLNVTSNSRFRTEGVDNPPPGPQGDDLLVLQHPITRRVSMFSRATRCYLAIAKKDLDDQKLEELTEEVILDKIRLLKTS